MPEEMPLFHSILRISLLGKVQVAVIDPTDRGGQPCGKQTVTPGGISYTPVSGYLADSLDRACA